MTMRKLLVSLDDLLHASGLERRHSFWSKSLPIAAGVGAGLVTGVAVTFALLTPARRARLQRGARGLLHRSPDGDPVEAPPPDVEAPAQHRPPPRA
jgi:hypothetical protein